MGSPRLLWASLWSVGVPGVRQWVTVKPLRDSRDRVQGAGGQGWQGGLEARPPGARERQGMGPGQAPHSEQGKRPERKARLQEAPRPRMGTVPSHLPSSMPGTASAGDSHGI